MNVFRNYLHYMTRPKYLFHRFMVIVLCRILINMRKSWPPAVAFYISDRPVYKIVLVFGLFYIFFTLAVRDDLEIFWNEMKRIFADLKTLNDED